MNKEILFAKTLENVRNLAKEQGNCISEEQVREAFGPLELSDSQFQMVFDYLTKHKIGIGAPMDLDEFLTDEERNYLQDYLDEIAQLPTYTEGQITAYTISAMAGDHSSSEKLIEAYLREVCDIAKLYTCQGVLLEDLTGEGNVALAMATEMLGSVETPEEAQGLIVQMIMNAMEDAIAEASADKKADEKMANKVNKVADKARELAEELHRSVTPEELSMESGLSMKAIEDAMRMSGYKIEDIEYGK
jgi:RNA polymerase primary sigma factor